MKKLFYPAIFHKAEEGGFWISFPDIPECLTEGDNIEDAYAMAADALGLFLYDQINNSQLLPPPSDPDSINLPDNSHLVIVEFNELEYRKKYGIHTVKKTLSIPAWLNEAATEKGINFSATLREALMRQLNM